MARITPDIEQLARACGVRTAYEDVHKRRQKASVESLLAVLNALGVDVPSMDDVPPALAAQRLAKHQRGITPVIVAWDGEKVEFDLTTPTHRATGKVDCMIEMEDHGDRISKRFDLDRMSAQASACGRFVTRRLRLARGLAWGYHRLRIEHVAQESSGGARNVPADLHYESLVISAPSRAYAEQGSAGGQWGCFLPLYALRSERNWGAGDFTDLQNLAAWTADLGGSVVGTLPLLAAFLDEPCEPSPYAPASRLAWNEFYIDVARIPELDDCPQAAELLQSSAFVDDVTQLRTSELVAYRPIMARKRQILEMLADTFFEQKPPQRYAQFQQFLEQRPHLENYAEFRAAYERRREPWHQWPLAMRGGRLSDNDFDRGNKHYHLYAQWIATAQLVTLADAAGGGLYLDLPLGVRPDGYDVWKWSDVYACGASAGSPPDAVWTMGQDWSFPPLHPARIREQGYRHVRDYLIHHLRLARLLRIDHVMQLHRLYWIPRGMRADQGVYVGYRPDELYAILNLESHRCQTTLIGENLGTVPPAVNRAMERHNLNRMYVVQYEVASADGESTKHAPSAVADPSLLVLNAQGDEHEFTAASRQLQTGMPQTADGARSVPPALHDVPAGALASLNTHDMPTFAAWWGGADISLRKELGLLNDDHAHRELAELETTKAELTTWLRSAGWLDGSETDEATILQSILNFLAASDAGVVLVNLEDLWLETQPQNVPGTGPDLPNWQRKAAATFDEFARHPEVLAALSAVAQWRQQAHDRLLGRPSP